VLTMVSGGETLTLVTVSAGCVKVETTVETTVLAGS
jgi:hypothetical protein